VFKYEVIKYHKTEFKKIDFKIENLNLQIWFYFQNFIAEDEKISHNFLLSFERIMSDGYQPSKEDILATKIPTTGTSNINQTISN